MPNKSKVRKVMSEYKEGKLKSGSGAKVKSRKQAVAIAMAEGGYDEPTPKKSSAARRLSMMKKKK